MNVVRYRESDPVALVPESLLAQAGVGVLDFSLTANLRRASPTVPALLGIADAAGLWNEPSPWKQALTTCVTEAAGQDGTAVTVVLSSRNGESLLATSQCVRAGKKRSRVICLVRRALAAPGPPNASGDSELLEAMVEGSQDGLWILAGTGQILNANQAAEHLTGLRREAVIGRNVKDFGEESEFDWSIIAEVMSKRIPVSRVQTLRAGSKLLVSGKSILSPDGNIQYLVLTLRDITEMNRLIACLHETRNLSEHYRRELQTVEMRELQVGLIVARSDAIRPVWDLALKYAAVDSPVLLLGETGSGKGVFSKIIHQASARAAGPFIEVNCGAIPEGLIEAELFGYARGAFTGADSRGKVGLVELAHSGTLLLNEIGDLPLRLQVKLLRFLEDGEIWPVGAVKGKRPDVRIIAATNHDLEAMMARGTFRRDLFYRLNVLTLQIPPLRERREDIPWLVKMMLSQFERKVHRKVVITSAALGLISQYDFPGNVRELWNLVERLVVTANADVIDVGDLPAVVSPLTEGVGRTDQGRDRNLRRALKGVEARILKDALGRYGTQALAAQHLGVSQATIARRAKLYGLTRETTLSVAKI